MTVNFPASAFEDALARAAAGMNEVGKLRLAIFRDDHVSPTDLKALFEFEERQRSHDPEWSDLFCDVVVRYMLEQEAPQGYVSEDNARQLIALIGEKSDARTDTELEALTRLIEKAREVPPFFSAFVLRQIKQAAIYSDGHSRRGGQHTPGCVDQHDLDLIRRVLWGAGSEGHLAVSLEEAEALFDIADATTGNDNDPAWDDFFARAIGNYLIGATGRHAPSREQSLQLWHTDYDIKIGSVLWQHYKHFFLHADQNEYRKEFIAATLMEKVEASAAEANVARERQIFEAENLSGNKADWLLERIKRNGVTSGPETALLAFIRREAGEVAPEVEKALPAPNPRAARQAFGRRTA